MPIDLFWHGELYLFGVYQKAYERRLHNEAWIYGMYNNAAFSVTYQSVWGSKNSKMLTYPDKPYDPYGNERNKLLDETNKEKARQREIYGCSLKGRIKGEYRNV